jgi:hypothetical protein
MGSSKLAAAHCPLTARLANRTEKKFHLGIFLFFSTSFSKQHHGEYFSLEFCLLDSHANEI